MNLNVKPSAKIFTEGGGYARGGRTGGKWIAGAIKHPGALHRALKVPMGKKIPAKKLATLASEALGERVEVEQVVRIGEKGTASNASGA